MEGCHTMSILVTGAAGFIGYHVAEALIARGDEVIGIDNLSDYYDVGLKKARLDRLKTHSAFTFKQLDIADDGAMVTLSRSLSGTTGVVHLAAQAGVRYSMVNPQAYLHSNVTGHLNILETCRHIEGLKHLVYASSSSVYGGNTSMPFSEDDPVDHPVSLYAATKKTDELMSHTYSHLYGIPATGLRFFTVYGPWGRPDMAYYSFAEAIFRLAFRIAGSMALQDAAKTAGVKLLEPVMALEIVTPEEYMGDVIGDLSARRGRVDAMEARPGGRVIKGSAPLAEMFGYVGDLRSRTQGRANYTMQFDSYQDVPRTVSHEIVAKVRGE